MRGSDGIWGKPRVQGWCFDVKLVKWIIALTLSLLLGILLVTYLTVHPLQIGLFVFLSSLTLFLLLIVLAVSFKRNQLWVVIPLSLAMVFIGWSVKTYQVLGREDRRPVPRLTRSKDDPGDGHTAVIYLTHGEPETYDPIGWINTFREFDRDGVSFIPFLVRPFFFHQLRQAYLRVGRSNHRQIHARMIGSLKRQYRAEGDSETKFYLCFLDDNPRADAAIIKALNEGASKIIVSLVFLTVSNHTEEGLEMIKAVKPEEYGVPFKATKPLWDSRTLQSMFVARANRHRGNTPKSKIGMLLVGHGQPDEWDKEFPTETEQETLFREEILQLFEKDGYEKGNLSSAWMAFKEPVPGPKVEQIVEQGAEKIMFFSAAISADSIHSQYDIPSLVDEAEIPKAVPVINLGAWNDDPTVIQAIKERIDQVMD